MQDSPISPKEQLNQLLHQRLHQRLIAEIPDNAPINEETRQLTQAIATRELDNILGNAQIGYCLDVTETVAGDGYDVVVRDLQLPTA